MDDIAARRIERARSEAGFAINDKVMVAGRTGYVKGVYHGSAFAEIIFYDQEFDVVGLETVAIDDIELVSDDTTVDELREAVEEFRQLVC